MQKAEAPPDAAKSRPLSKQPDFLKLWSGQSISMVGSEITDLALPLVAIYTLHAGAVSIGLVNTARWLPFLLISLWVGAWTDRHKRRRLLIRVDLGRAAVMGSIVVMGLTHVLTVPLLVLAVFIFGVLTVLFDVSYYSYVPAIVSSTDLLPANARLQASASVAQVGGPGLGGLLVQIVGAPFTLMADAISFLVSAASLTWIRAVEPEPEPPVRGENIVRQIRAGIAVVLHDRLLRALVGTSAIYNAFSQWIVTLFALFAVRDLGMTAGMIGAVVSVAAVGALAGSLVTKAATSRMGVGSAMIWSVGIECTALFALPFAPTGNRPIAFLILAGAFGVNGIGVALSSVVAISIRQTVTPRDMLGRMNATYRFVSYGVIALGALFGGLAGQLWGPRTGMLIGCVGLLSTIAWVALGPLPRLKELPTGPAGVAAPAEAIEEAEAIEVAARAEANGLAEMTGLVAPLEATALAGPADAAIPDRNDPDSVATTLTT